MKAMISKIMKAVIMYHLYLSHTRILKMIRGVRNQLNDVLGRLKFSHTLINGINHKLSHYGQHIVDTKSFFNF